jgi:hypothetical protein
LRSGKGCITIAFGRIGPAGGVREMRDWKSFFTAGEPEYRAALNGIAIFFGAILGVALGGVEGLDPLPFMTLLVMVSGVVVTILYIPASRRRVAYAAGLLALLAIILFTHRPGDMVLGSFPLPPQLIPTLIVWTAATILVEYGPRRGRAAAEGEAAHLTHAPEAAAIVRAGIAAEVEKVGEYRVRVLPASDEAVASAILDMLDRNGFAVVRREPRVTETAA